VAPSSARKAPHQVRAGKAARGRNLIEALSALLEHSLCGFDPHAPDVACRRRPHFASEDALEIPDAHRYAIRQVLAGQILVQILCNPHLKLLNRLHYKGL